MIRSALITLDLEKSPGLGSADVVLAGLPWLVRWIKTAHRAGVENFIVVGENDLETSKQALQETLSKSGIRVSWVHLSQGEVLKQMIHGLGSPRELWIEAPWNSFISKKVWQNLQGEKKIPHPSFGRKTNGCHCDRCQKTHRETPR